MRKKSKELPSELFWLNGKVTTRGKLSVEEYLNKVGNDKNWENGPLSILPRSKLQTIIDMTSSCCICHVTPENRPGRWTNLSHLFFCPECVDKLWATLLDRRD